MEFIGHFLLAPSRTIEFDHSLNNNAPFFFKSPLEALWLVFVYGKRSWRLVSVNTAAVN